MTPFPTHQITSARAVILSAKQNLEKLLGVKCEIEVKHYDHNEKYVELILGAIESATCVSIAEIRSSTKSGEQKVKRAKLMSAALVKIHCSDFILDRVASSIGFHDAAQVTRAISRHEDLLFEDDKYRATFLLIQSKLTDIPREKYVLNYSRS